jgi:hypothetical protein
VVCCLLNLVVLPVCDGLNWLPIFFGPIPTEIGNVSNLRDLNRSSNQLIGPIPSESGEFEKLMRLELQSNKRNGTIFLEFSQLKEATYVPVDDNDLRGLFQMMCV